MKRLAVLIALSVGAVGLLFVLQHRFGRVPPLGTILDPWDGMYRTARQAGYPKQATLTLEALQQPVTILRDERGVPHIFSSTDLDAVAALGYLLARDRLFQLDFITRVAAGRLSAALGPAALSTDRYLRRTGMEQGARRNWRRIQRENGIEKRLVEAYVAGVNAYVSNLSPEELPFEFRLLGYAPDPYTPVDLMRLLEYMTFNLTYGTDRPGYAALREALGKNAFQLLYPRHHDLFVPIIPSSSDTATRANGTDQTGVYGTSGPFEYMPHDLRGTIAEGYRPGKGSNNWAVGPDRSTTGAPILAGDMHLDLTLPSIWYEAHLVTPSMNTYGVTLPGAPLPIEAYNDRVGWTLTNTGTDQIDHYALTLDSTGSRYRYEGAWRSLRIEIDTIPVAGASPVIDTLRYTRWGPVVQHDPPVAAQWVGHKPSRTLRALWGMNRANNEAEVQEALRFWDTPGQNILTADRGGTISIRSTGHLPVRRAGHGIGLLDGSTDQFAWTGRVPFADLPYSRQPAQGYLSSTNQPPTDSTFAYYLGHDWRDAYRSLRIDTLLSRKARHSVRDLARYQSDVHVMQHDLFAPLLDTLRGLPPRADSLRRMLLRWNGEASRDRPEPLAMWAFMEALQELAWDEPVFAGRTQPKSWRLYRLLTEKPDARWLDVTTTFEREDAAGLLRRSLTVAADTLAQRYGWNPEHWRWGDHHHVVFQHLISSDALEALGRGSEPWPGFHATLSAAQPLRTTHSASWRMVVDFSKSPPAGYGVYPGGQSGNPFSRLYDLHLPTYLEFDYYALRKPENPAAMDDAQVASRLTLRPSR